MKRVLEIDVDEKAARHREWKWCRRANGFSDNPLWRMVAAELGLPIFQVVAFVNRLEELANTGEPRGSVAEFRAGEFGAALGMPAEDAARIFAALESGDARWIDGEHLTSFYRRNPDKEDPTAAKRMQRYRDRREIRKHLRRMEVDGRITQPTRRHLEDGLKDLPDDALQALLQRTRRGEVDGLLSTDRSSSRYGALRRNDRNVTPRADQSFISPPVDNSGDGARDEAEESPKGESGPQPVPVSTWESDAAVHWLETEGLRIVVERMVVTRAHAGMLIERWGRDLDDPMAVVSILLGADRPELSQAQFHVLVTSHVDRMVRTKAMGLPLPLPPVPIGAFSKAAARKQAIQEQPASVAEPDEIPAAEPLRKLAG